MEKEKNIYNLPEQEVNGNDNSEKQVDIFDNSEEDINDNSSDQERERYNAASLENRETSNRIYEFLDTEKAYEYKQAEETYDDSIESLASYVSLPGDITEKQKSVLMDAAKEHGSEDVRVGAAEYLAHLQSESMRLLKNYFGQFRQAIEGDAYVSEFAQKARELIMGEIQGLNSEIKRFLPEGSVKTGELRCTEVEKSLYSASLAYDRLEDLNVYKDLKVYDAPNVDKI